MYTSVSSILSAYDANQITLWEVFDGIVRLLTVENVDVTIASVPEPIREKFVRYARDAYVGRDGSQPLVEPAGAPDTIPREAYAAIQDWLLRHPG